MKEKFISLGGILVSIVIIVFALTYDIDTQENTDTSNNVSEKIETSVVK